MKSPKDIKRAAMARDAQSDTFRCAVCGREVGGQASPLWWLYTVALTAAFFAFALLIWRAGLRRYESASS